ncbi:MAG: hypothetical protein HY719_11810, partial [Planctomycetes bacterium]|nr:hypothetical protein [Planctomycetota bacterium]
NVAGTAVSIAELAQEVRKIDCARRLIVLDTSFWGRQEERSVTLEGVGSSPAPPAPPTPPNGGGATPEPPPNNGTPPPGAWRARPTSPPEGASTPAPGAPPEPPGPQADGEEPGGHVFQLPMLVDDKTAVFLACDGTQEGAAREGAAQAEMWSQGVFSYYLLDALSGRADEDRNGLITLDEMSAYVTPRVANTAGMLNAKQRPTVLQNRGFQFDFHAPKGN